MSLEQALPLADIITVHSSGSACILGAKELAIMKSGSFLLNAARGDLIDESALTKALDEGKIKGIWMDTFNQEPYSGSLIKYPQVILTPHVGSYTAECRKRMELEAASNLISGLKGNL
jgi:D-3-phosphoglycerate dehydrogenase